MGNIRCFVNDIAMAFYRLVGYDNKVAFTFALPIWGRIKRKQYVKKNELESGSKLKRTERTSCYLNQKEAICKKN